MPNITFYTNKAGTLVANWPGKSVMTDKGPRKVGQRYLGKVINRDKLIFWSRSDGYYTFNPEDQTTQTIAAEDLPVSSYEPDGSRRKPPIVVDFGDSYFLDHLFRDTGYDQVINILDCRNRDTLYAMLHYYILEDAANCHADIWYRHNYASYLYPRANIYSQRISDLLSCLGTPEQKRNFLLKHIEYVLSSTDGEVSVLIDSTGMPNKCSLPVTRVSTHEGETNIEFRMIALVQKDTGLPLFYEIIHGNIVDISTVERIIRLAKEYHCEVSYAIGDAGYCCPSTMEKLVLAGVDFMTRLNPAYDNFTRVMEEHGHELDKADAVRYRDRLVRMVKVPSQIAVRKDTGEAVTGYIYLCKDMQSSASKQDHLMGSPKCKDLTTAEIMNLCSLFGIFAIVTTRDLEPEEVLPEYYIRQNVEQYFDFGKNYARFIPVRQQTMETLAGHMLLAFIATFVIILIKNRLNLVDTHYSEVPLKLCKGQEEDLIPVEDETGKIRYFQQQDPILEVFRVSPSTLFYELRGQKAEIFDNEIIPCVPVRQAKDFYEAFKLVSPLAVLRKETGLEDEYYENTSCRLTRKVVFGCKPGISDERILKKRQEQKLKKAHTAAESVGLVAVEPPVKRKPGRPKGSKNKKTLLREAAEAAAKASETKRGRGRPKGAKDKKKRQRKPGK